ncbi:MAG: hypothetical protein K1X39_11945 [Thermoflexales bacterium]|nr:hypothetical protein [Thermoflexales bacterium]
MTTQIATLRLTTGELFVALNEMNLGSGMLGATSSLAQVPDTELSAFLVDGRARLLARGLLRPDEYGKTVVAPGLRHVLVRSVRPQAAIWLMRASTDAKGPAQTFIALDREGGVAYRPDADAALHDFIPIAESGALAQLATEIVMTQAMVDAQPGGARPRSWMLPLSLITAVTERAAEGDAGDDPTGLMGAGMSAADAAELFEACRSTETRGALTGYATGAQGLSLVWMARAGVMWTVRMDGDSGMALVRRCDLAAAAQQAAALAVNMAGRVWRATVKQ